MLARRLPVAPRTDKDLLADQRGAVSTEYVVLLGTVGLAVVFSLVAVGPTLLRDYEFTRTYLAAPIP